MEKKMDSSLRSFRDGTVQKPHSLKIPSNKKSSAFPGVQSQLPSTRPPFQRPTSHMWNRRGRLKELRIRCMARKFLYLWIQKTFGRIFPSKARLYCQRKVLRKVFREWKEEWWISHREWKLCIRADCHYRYYLYNLTFQTWRAYVHQQQEMRNKYMRAEDHGEKRRQRPLEMVPKCNFVEALEKEKHIDYLLLFSRRHVNLYAEQIIREAGLYEEEHGVRIGGRCINNLPYADDTTLLAESEEDLKVLLQRLTDCRVQHGLTIFRLCQQTMRRAWKSWLIYVVVRRTKLQMQTAAVEFRQQSTLWVWWRVWRRSLGEVHMCRALHASAVKHRDRSLQLQAWSRWWEQLLRVWRDRQKMACALKHHQHVQKRSSLRAWLEYLQLRRVKRLKEEMAAQFHRVHVLQTHFCGWQQAQKWRENLYAHRVLVEALARRMVLRRAFTHWKCYVLMCAEAATQCKMAEEHHRRRLLTFCLRVLQDNVARARLQQIRRNLAHQQHEAVLLRRCWHAWLCRVEQREEQKQSSLLRDARAHYRVTVLHKCFTLWLLRTQKSRSKQMLQARADSHFQRRALPAAFQAWRRRWQQHQHSRALNVRAARFHREMLERQVLVIWWQKMFQHRENRLAERVAILHSEQQLLLRAWSMWRQQAAAHHQEQQRHALACVHHQHWQLRRAFRVWRESAQGHRTEKLGKAQAVEFHSLQLLRGTWNRWRECLAMLQVERQKLVLADLHHQSSLLRRVLRRWLTYQDKVRHVLREVAARESRHNRHLLRAALRHWRKNTVVRVDEAKKAFQAYEHYTRTICSKVLAQWREAASIQIYYRQQEDSAISEARVVLDRGCVRTAFLRWRNHSWSAARQRTQMERAAQHHTRQLLRGAVSRWKAYYRGRIRKTLLQRRGAQFLAQRLSQFCFHQWSQQLAARREEQRSTARALWFWSFSLQAKAWDAWLGFVLERRRKKERLEQAVQAYHQQLLHSGVTCLLRFAAHSKASRQQLLAQQQAQVAHSLHRTVLRCAMLWKRKALGEAREPRPLVSSRRATFKVPRLGGITDGAGNTTTMEAKTQGTRPRGGLDSLALAAGDAPLLELNVARPERKQPRCPNFLLELEQSQKIVGCGPVREQKAELEPGFRMAPVASSSLTQPFLVETQRALVPQSPLSEPRARPRPPGPRLPPPASTDAELVLLPPSSFTLPRADTPAGVPSARPGRPHLLLPGDFTGAGAHPGLGSEVAGSPELEIELEGIRQQLQNYQSTKQNLGSCRRQAHSLRRWLELSREEPQPEDQEVEQQVQKELEEVEAQIQHLATELRAQRQPIRACIARVQALRQALR